MADSRLRICGVTRMFSEEAGVQDIDLEVDAGEIHALVGLNGAGKSTLLKLILGMLRPDQGSIMIDGRSVGDFAAWSSVGHLIEYPLAYAELTTRANLILGARLHGVRPAEIAGVVAESIEEFALSRYADVVSRRLSLGNRQKLGLASALQHHPRLVVLDEPTNALDPKAVIMLREALLSRAGNGAAVLVSSHHLDEVARIADRVTVINSGRVIGALDPDGVDLERAFFDLVYADVARSEGLAGPSTAFGR